MPTKQTRNLILAVIVTAIVVGASTWTAAMYYLPAKPLTSVTLMVNYTFNGRHAPFFVGLAKGFFADEGITLIITPSTGSGIVAAAVDQGTADFGQLSGASAIQYIGNGAKFQIFMAYSYWSTDSWAYRTDMISLVNLQDMIGKTIASNPGSDNWVLTQALLTKAGLDPSKVNVLNVAPAAQVQGLISGQWAAFDSASDGTWPIVQQQAAAKNVPVAEALLKDWGLDVIGYVVVCRLALMQSNPSLVKAFARATIKSVLYTIAHPAEAVSIMLKANPLMDNQSLTSQVNAAIPTFTGLAKYATIAPNYGQIAPDQVSNSIYWASLTASPTFVKPTPQQVFTTAYLPY